MGLKNSEFLLVGKIHILIFSLSLGMCGEIGSEE